MNMNTLQYYHEKGDLLKSFECEPNCSDCLLNANIKNEKRCAIWWTARHYNANVLLGVE
jgi:hypothetical protein